MVRNWNLKMAKKKSLYKCSECGYESSGYLGKCPECGSWGSLKEVMEDTKKAVKKEKSIKSKAMQLKTVTSSNSDRLKTSFEEFNRVMGEGIVKDSVTILTAKPGAGKSTLLLQIANDACKKGLKVLYASGEESESQIKQRADRILDTIEDDLYIISDTSLDNIKEEVLRVDADMVVVDSIQTVELDEYKPSRPASPTQTVECAYELVNLAKNIQRPRIVFIVGQMTKDDELRGVRTLEHLVDTVLIMDTYQNDSLRTIVASKNRYGATGEMGFMNMQEKGLVSIDNPSEYFVSARKENNFPGSAITVNMEGTRPVILEVEALVTKSYTPYPSRISENMSREKLNTLLSIMEKRLNVDMFDKNVVIKSMGGLKLKEDASNLALIAAIYSQLVNKVLSSDTVYIADISLTGELKKVPQLERRLKEAERMGYKRAVISSEAKLSTKFTKLELIKCSSLIDALKL